MHLEPNFILGLVIIAASVIVSVLMNRRYHNRPDSRVGRTRPNNKGKYCAGSPNDQRRS